MKYPHALKTTIFLALTAMAVAAQDATPVRRELKVGALETYKIENEIKQLVDVPNMGEQDMLISTSATIAVKTLKVDSEKGRAEVETVTKIDKASIDGSLAAMMGGQDAKLPEAKKELGTLDSRNRIVIALPKDKPAGQGGGNPMAMMGMGGITSMGAQSLLNLIELPEKPMKIGESIEVLVPSAAGAGTMGVKDLKMTLKLIGEREVEGVKLWVVNYVGNMKLNMEPSKDPKEAQGPMSGMKMNGTAILSGEGLIDKSTGKTVSNVMTVNNDVKLFIEQAGMEIPVKGTVKMKLTLVK